MRREDLLALGEEDLIRLANKGKLRRAQKELERGRVEGDWALLEDGTLQVQWSDGPQSILPPGASLEEASCDCVVAGLCRHLLRAVLLYQRDAAGEEPGELERSEQGALWDPGQIEEEAILALVGRGKIKRWRASLEELEEVVELSRSGKPTARFYALGHTVRFMVPGDLRYAACGCAESAPCRHAVWAIWAFRQMEQGRAQGRLPLGRGEARSDGQLLEQAEASTEELLRWGLASLEGSQVDAIWSQCAQLRRRGEIWPAQLLEKIAGSWELYQEKDARFSAAQLALWLGEYFLRLDALAAEELPVPRLFVRGASADSQSKLGAARFVGLGCMVRQEPGATEVMALLQEIERGELVALGMRFEDPVAEEGRAPARYAVLGNKLMAGGRTIRSLGSSQLVLERGKLSAERRLELGRAQVSVYPQEYRFGDLMAPVGVEGFEELEGWLQQQPPSAYRPRRIGQGLHALEIAELRQGRFVTSDQSVRAQLVDQGGASAELVFPYMSRNAAGSEQLLRLLQQRPEQICAVAGHVRRAAQGLELIPTAVIVEEQGARRCLQPWVEDWQEGQGLPERSARGAMRLGAAAGWRRGAQRLLGELVLTGARSWDEGMSRRWGELVEGARRHGYLRAAALLSGLVSASALGVEELKVALQWLSLEGEVVGGDWGEDALEG